jgi:hypothetical protein
MVENELDMKCTNMTTDLSVAYLTSFDQFATGFDHFPASFVSTNFQLPIVLTIFDRTVDHLLIILDNFFTHVSPVSTNYDHFRLTSDRFSTNFWKSSWPEKK